MFGVISFQEDNNNFFVIMGFQEKLKNEISPVNKMKSTISVESFHTDCGYWKQCKTMSWILNVMTMGEGRGVKISCWKIDRKGIFKLYFFPIRIHDCLYKWRSPGWTGKL